jgi:4'-phosphopantetheinyl transferase
MPEPGDVLGPREVPAPGEVYTWALDLDAALEPEVQGRCEEALRPQERARAERFAKALDGRRWARARALLRVLLGECLEVAPGAILFESGAHGKPRLAVVRSSRRTGAQADLRFNMAHSGPVAVYAVAEGMEVGVDVEARLRRANILAAARRAFGASTAERLAALDPNERERQALRLWVRHEAALKCLGVGLAGAKQAEASQRPWVAELQLRDGAVGAVAAIDAEPERVVCWRDQSLG